MLRLQQEYNRAVKIGFGLSDEGGILVHRKGNKWFADDGTPWKESTIWKDLRAIIKDLKAEDNNEK